MVAIVTDWYCWLEKLLLSKSIEEGGGGSAVEAGISPFWQIKPNSKDSWTSSKGETYYVTLAVLQTCMAHGDWFHGLAAP